jgi:hypothetical protein
MKIKSEREVNTIPEVWYSEHKRKATNSIECQTYINLIYVKGEENYVKVGSESKKKQDQKEKIEKKRNSRKKSQNMYC